METTSESIEKKIMPGDLLSPEESLKLVGQANDAIINDDLDEAFRIIGMFTIDKKVADLFRKALGEDKVEYLVNKGIVFGDK